jgi:hypothetical protein
MFASVYNMINSLIRHNSKVYYTTPARIFQVLSHKNNPFDSVFLTLAGGLFVFYKNIYLCRDPAHIFVHLCE